MNSRTVGLICISLIIWMTWKSSYLYHDKYFTDYERWPVVQYITTPSTCSPHHHIMFAKTHKCASSTIQNIMLRYGYQHNLTFALGRPDMTHINILGYYDKFNYKMLNQDLLLPAAASSENRRAAMFMMHSRLNIQEHRKAVHPDAKWITIIRDPVDQFASAFDFYNLKKKYGMDLKTFLRQPIEVLRNIYVSREKKGRETLTGRFTVLWDLGFPDTLPLEKMDDVINTLKNTFHIVMITERIDESLILLRDELCWSNENILSFKINARMQSNDKLSDKMANKIRRMNKEDTIIYHYFLNKHIQAVEAFGIDKMSAEVVELRRLRKEAYDKCVAEEVLGQDEKLGHIENRLVKGFIPTDNNDETCKLVTMGEIQFVEFVTERQKELVKNIKSESKS